jgi:hypothetical protein
MLESVNSEIMLAVRQTWQNEVLSAIETKKATKGVAK